MDECLCYALIMSYCLPVSPVIGLDLCMAVKDLLAKPKVPYSKAGSYTTTGHLGALTSGSCLGPAWRREALLLRAKSISPLAEKGKTNRKRASGTVMHLILAQQKRVAGNRGVCYNHIDLRNRPAP
jgi:hypothetical protein